MTLLSNLHGLTSQVLARAIESTVSPLIITDNQLPDNPIIYANQAFLDLCGYEESEIVGRNCRFLQGRDSDKQVVSSIRKAVDARKDIRVTLKNHRKDGSVFWNDLVISPIKDDEGKTTHFIGMQLDITDRIVYTEKLEKTQDELLRANQELEQFTYAASHDLQEPLRMVSSYLQLINKRYHGGFDEDGAKFMAFAVEGAERMQSLINDLLTLSRVSSTGREFKKVDLTEVVQRACFNLKLSIDETNTQIDVDDLPTIPADSTQMVQLLQNLISNAIKYRSTETTPHIKISCEQDDTKIIISVADNGIGIDEQYHERVFAIFQRLHTREEYPGTGVGLAICSKIIDRHNGKIWVESNTDGGSTFKFSLPAKRKAAR